MCFLLLVAKLASSPLAGPAAAFLRWRGERIRAGRWPAIAVGGARCPDLLSCVTSCSPPSAVGASLSSRGSPGRSLLSSPVRGGQPCGRLLSVAAGETLAGGASRSVPPLLGLIVGPFLDREDPGLLASCAPEPFSFFEHEFLSLLGRPDPPRSLFRPRCLLAPLSLGIYGCVAALPISH